MAAQAVWWPYLRKVKPGEHPKKRDNQDQKTHSTKKKKESQQEKTNKQKRQGKLSQADLFLTKMQQFREDIRGHMLSIQGTVSHKACFPRG
jgi:hypothetical protein